MSSTNKRSSNSSSSSRTPTKRLLTELSAFNSSQPSSHPGVESLAPVSSSNLLSLRAILTGSAPNALSRPTSHLQQQDQSQQQPFIYPPVPASSGYTHGRWLLSIRIPETYPVSPPVVTFVTKICHPNVKWETGEVCLDVLKENWTPVLGVVGVLESIVRLLGEPGVDSPLGVEVAALLRGGDAVGARSLVGFWCGEERFEGAIEEGEGR